MPVTTIDPTARVADIVTAHPECARVLKEHRIDFCCKGQQPLSDACAQGGQDLEVVLGDLEAALAARAGRSEATDPRRLSVPALVALIIDRHHGWLREALPWIEAMAIKVARVHGEHDPRLADLGRLVADLRPLLLDHLDEEEQQLFPALMARHTPAEVVRDGLAAMEAEHRQVGALLERARALTDDFTAPGWACGTYRTLLAELEHLEDDVLRHVHLENHVLAVKARRG